MDDVSTRAVRLLAVSVRNAKLIAQALKYMALVTASMVAREREESAIPDCHAHILIHQEADYPNSKPHISSF